MASNPRDYLDVPYAERQAARDAGARWDAEAKAWYAGAAREGVARRAVIHDWRRAGSG